MGLLQGLAFALFYTCMGLPVGRVADTHSRRNLISVGVLLLLHNFGRLELHTFFTRWWPLLVIFWGIVKLYERTLGRRFGSGGVTSGEVFLVLGMFALLGVVVLIDIGKQKLPPGIMDMGDNFTFDIDVAPKTTPSLTIFRPIQSSFSNPFLSQ